MEKDLLDRINKLKQDLTAVSNHKPKQSEDLAAYLSQSYKKPSTPELQPFNTNSYTKLLLEEKQSRIAELEEEVAYLREKIQSQEQDMTSKYEKAIDSIKKNFDSLLKYYEMQLQESKFRNEHGNLDELLDSFKELQQENYRLKSEIKSQDTIFKKEKSNLEKEISILRDKANDTVECIKNRDSEYSSEIDDLRDTKHKLETDIADLQKNKTECIKEIVESYEQRCSQIGKIAAAWKTKANQLARKSFTFSRNVKIDLYEIKNEILNNFEDAMNNANSSIARLYKKSKVVSVN
jgi:chromosome segregation ATPase